METQNINVPACRFYAKHGFTLGAINRYAYTEVPDEIELIWCKKLQTKANAQVLGTASASPPVTAPKKGLKTATHLVS